MHLLLRNAQTDSPSILSRTYHITEYRAVYVINTPYVYILEVKYLEMLVCISRHLV